MQSWNQVIPDNPKYIPKTKIKPIQPNLQFIYEEIQQKYPEMKFKIRRNGQIFIYGDSELADRMKSWKSPYNEMWNYRNQLTARETRLNKRIIALKSP